MEKLLIIQPVMAHYRKSLFTILSEDKNQEVVFIAGNKYQQIQSFTLPNTILLNYHTFSLFQHRFYYLKGSLKAILKEKPDSIISSGIDPHLIHTILIFFIQKLRGKSFYWWSHASAGNQGRLGLALRMFFYRRSDGILTYNDQGKQFLIKNGIAPGKLVKLGNSLNSNEYGFRKSGFPAQPKKDNRIHLIFCGRLKPSRRLDILIKTVAYLKNEIKVNVDCVIVGEGENEDLTELSRSLGLEKIISFAGPKYGDDVSPYLLQADIMVYPKAIGLSILQAYSYGIPVITTDAMNIQMPEIELLQAGETGDFFKDENIEDLGNKILKWFEIIKDSKTEIQQKCINKIHDFGYFPDQMAGKLLGFINR